MQDESLLSVLAALAANTAIAVAKGVAAALTGSAALFAETLHTIADAGNEILLWIAVRRSGRPADPSHPLGYGPERYYWALLAAVGMFVVGGAVSIWQGIRALLHPPELESFWVGVAVLVIALVLDGSSRIVAIRTLRRQASRLGISMRQLLRESPDPTVTTIYLEDTIDVLGAALALVALILHKTTGLEWPDAVASLMIGGLLSYVAVRLSSRNRALLANQAVSPRIAERVRDRLLRQDGIVAVRQMESVYLGPREALVAADVVVDCSDIPATLERVRDDVLRDVPFIARLYLTPVRNLRVAYDDGMLRDLYAKFNARDIEAVLEHLTDDVDWANGMTGGRVHGRAAVREYWTNQFTQIDGHVEPVAITELPDGRTAVEVHQVVRTPDGELLSDTHVTHTYEFRDGLVSRMEIS
ncbi:cation diffusion facilitator family transporter [Candidatus Solirubrobacter pratensis]|uniref:cation diffusion facilitator family transporter n=1 Tax=Candidatus Solirubrobacter pratensis TaxID=1298857 RepID=UPI00040F4629|nr:cation diffusion facilitator family transporter [Candidatus Solirubrobacter pratensis]